jgi:hypothetical protein
VLPTSPRPLPEQGGHPNLALFTFCYTGVHPGRRVDALDGRQDKSVPTREHASGITADSFCVD